MNFSNVLAATSAVLFFGGLAPAQTPFFESDLFSHYADNDHAEKLVDRTDLVRTLADMEAQGLLSSTLTQKPWSDSYWPLRNGLTAIRYADPGFPKAKNIQTNYDYFLSSPPQRFVDSGNTDELAPSEKYDYLLGDANFTLTKSQWEYGISRKTVAYWAGICDGWAQASINESEPIHAITVTGAGGRHVKFYPSDIKALSSLMWAKDRVPVNFISSRCGKANPDRDDVGRILAPECVDTNPGTWHLAVINQLGRAKLPLIINATYDYEIWNYPVWEYSYSYFNPQTLEPAKFWRDAVVPIRKFVADRFQKYRAAETRYIAGISMDFTYMVELEPTHAEGHHASPKIIHYTYDVELDSQMNIIGGEWYGPIHPDYMWLPKPGLQPLSKGDAGLNAADWTGTNEMPAMWTQAALISGPQLQPLSAVVNKLIALSSQGGPE